MGILPPLALGVVVLDVDRYRGGVYVTLADRAVYSGRCDRYLPSYASDSKSDLWTRLHNTAEIR